VVWTEKAKGSGSEPFYERIPDYVDLGPAESLTSIFRLSLKEKRLLALIDMPGTGKTVTVAKAAQTLEAVYLHLSLQDVAMKTIAGAMKDTYAGSLDGLTCRDVREKMARVASSGLATVLKNAADNCTGGFTWLSNGVLAKGVNEACKAPGDLEAAKRRLQENLQSGQRVIVHVDEAQILASRKSTDLRAIQDQPATTEFCSALLLTALSDALYSVQSTGSDPFRVVLTGTLESIAKSIRISSPSKLDTRPALSEFTPAVVKRVVSLYATFPGIEEKELDEVVYEQLCGPARITQFFLDQLWAHRKKDPSDSVMTLEVLKLAVEKTQLRWSEEILSRMQVEVLPQCLAAQLFLAMAAPEGLGGSREIDDTAALGYTVRLPTTIIPSEWFQYVDSGGFRLKPSTDTHTLLYPAYPFLRDALAQRCAIVEPEAARMLLEIAAGSWKDPQKRVGPIAEVVVALEAAISSSPLHELLINATQNHRTQLKYGPTYTFRTDNDLRWDEETPSIGIVIDGSYGVVRLGDVVVPINYNKTRVPGFIEVKAVKDMSVLKKAVKHTADKIKKAFNTPDSGVPPGSVFAFLSIHPIDLVDHRCKVKGSGADYIKKCLLETSKASPSPFNKVEILNTTKKPFRATLKATTRRNDSVFFTVASSVKSTFFRFDLLSDVAHASSGFNKSIPSLIEKLAPSLAQGKPHSVFLFRCFVQNLAIGERRLLYPQGCQHCLTSLPASATT
jgi:hypothetical protein